MNTDFKRKINKRTFLLLTFVLLAVVGFSLGFGLAANNLNGRASGAGLHAQDTDGQYEWDAESAPAYDASRTLTVEPGVQKTVSGLYLLNPKGTIMPARNNHLHIQVNFTYKPGVWTGTQYTPGTESYTYKYSMGDTQALGNNGIDQTSVLYYPRTASDDNCLFKIEYVPDDVTFSLNLTFNSMTPTGEGTFDIRYFGHPSRIDSCDYVSAYNAANTAAGGNVDAAVDSYYYFDYNYGRNIYKKQVLQVKVEKQFAAGADDNGLPVLRGSDYYDLGKQFDADESNTVTPESTTLYPYQFLNVSNDAITTSNTYRDYNSTYSFVEGTFQATRNDPSQPGATETFKLSDYFDIQYVPYITNLRDDRHPSNDVTKEPVPSTFVTGGSAGGGTDTILTTNSDSNYFNKAYAIKLVAKGNLFDLYGHTIYCSATVKRFGHSMTLQTTAKFKFTVEDKIVQNISSYDGANIGDNVAFYTLRTGKAGGENLTLDINDVISMLYGENANTANSRYEFVEFPSGTGNPGNADDTTNEVRYCAAGATGVDCSGHGKTSHAGSPNQAGYDKVFDTSANGFGIGTDANGRATKFTLVRSESSTYTGKLYVLLSVRDARSVSGKTDTLCVRIDVPSEGIAVRDLAAMANDLSGLQVTANNTIYTPITVKRNTTWFMKGANAATNPDTAHFSLANYLYECRKNSGAFEFTDANEYKNDADGGKRSYGIQIEAKYFYEPVTGSDPVRFASLDNSVVEDTPYTFRSENEYYSWMLSSEGILYIYPNKGTSQYESANSAYKEIPALDVVVAVGASGTLQKFRSIKFQITVGNTAPDSVPEKTLKDLAVENGLIWNLAWGSTEANENTLHLIADDAHGYNAHKKLGGNTIQNNNPYNLSQFFEWDVKNWLSDADLPGSGAGLVNNYDSLSFIIALSGANAIGWDYSSKAEMQVQIPVGEGTDENGWISVADYLNKGKTDVVTRIRFKALSQLNAQPCSIVVKDQNGGTARISFYVAVEDSKPYYVAGEAVHGIANAAESSDALYRESVDFNPLMLRANVIDSSATAIRFMDWNITSNGATKGYDYYAALHGVLSRQTYNINDLLIDPDAAGELGYAVSQKDGATGVAFQVTSGNTVFTDGGKFFAKGGSGLYTADITTENGDIVATVSFRNAHAGVAKAGDVTIVAKAAVADTVKLEFQVSRNGIALEPDTEAINTYGFTFALLSSLPTANNSTSVDTLNKYSVEDGNAKTFVQDSLVNDGYITDIDKIDDGKLYFIVKDRDISGIFPYIQYYCYTTDSWVNVFSYDAYINTDKTKAMEGSEAGNDFDFRITYVGNTISIMANRNRTDRKTLSVRFFVSNLSFTDGYKYDAIGTKVENIATPVTYSFIMKEAGVIPTDTTVNVTASDTNWGGIDGTSFSGEKYNTFYKVNLKDIAKVVKEENGGFVEDPNLADLITFHYLSDYASNFSMAYNSTAKKHLYFKTGTPVIGKIHNSIYTGPTANAYEADVLLNFDTKQIWVKPQNRTMSDQDWFDFNVTLTVADGNTGGSVMGATPSGVQVKMTVDDAAFNLAYDTIDYTENNPEYAPGLFNLDGSGVTISVQNASDGNKDVIYPADGSNIDLIAKAFSDQRRTGVSVDGMYYDTNDRYFVAMPANIPDSVSCVGDGDYFTVADGTIYYEKIHVKPLKKVDSIELAFSVLDCLYVNDVNVSYTLANAKNLKVTFGMSDSNIKASGSANQLNIVGQTVFVQDGTKEVIGACRAANHDLAEFVFCDGEKDYRAVRFDTNFSNKLLSSIFSTRDGAAADGIFANVYGSLSVKFYEANADGTANKNKPIAGKDILPINLTELVSGAKTLKNDWLQIGIENQIITVTLISRKGMEGYSTGVVGELTYSAASVEEAGTGKKPSASYDFRIQTVANRVITKTDAARRVAFNADGSAKASLAQKPVTGADGITRAHENDFVYNFNGDTLTFQEGGVQFADYDTAFKQLYQGWNSGESSAEPYVTQRRTVSSGVAGVNVTLSKLHRTFGDLTGNHLQEYTLNFTVIRYASGNEELSVSEVPGSPVTLTFYYDDSKSQPETNEGFGKIDAATGTQYLTYENGGNDSADKYGRLFAMQTAAGRTTPNSFTIYGSKDLFVADPYALGDVLNSKNPIGSVAQNMNKWVVGNIGSNSRALQNVINFTDLGTAQICDRDGNVVSGLNVSNFIKVEALKTFDGKGLSSSQLFGIVVTAQAKLDEDHFIRLTFTAKDTSGNAVTYGETDGKVTIDFRVVNSETLDNKNSSFYQGEGKGYATELQSSREAWEAVCGVGNKPDRELPGVQRIPLNQLIDDGDYRTESYQVFVGDLQLTDNALYTFSNANRDVVFKMGYDAASKDMLFYSFKQIPFTTIEGLRVVSETGDTVHFSGTTAFQVGIPDSLPILLKLTEEQKVFSLSYNEYTNVALGDYLYDYDGDKILRDATSDVTATATMGNETWKADSEEFKKYFEIGNRDDGAQVYCKGLLREAGDQADRIVLNITIKFITRIDGKDTAQEITLHSEYENDAPVFSKRQLPSSDYDMKYDGGILTITYTGADARFGETLFFNLDSFMDLSGYLKENNNFTYKQFLTINGTKRVDSIAGGRNFYEKIIDNSVVGTQLTGSFVIKDSTGNNPVFLSDDGTRAEIRTISFVIVVANTDPVAKPQFEENGTEDEREVGIVSPGSSFEFSAGDLVDDPNTKDTLQFVPDMTQEGETPTYDENVALKGNENAAFTAKYIPDVNGNYTNIKVTVDENYNINSAQNVVIITLKIRDNHAGSRLVVLRNVTVTVVLKPSQAIDKTSGGGDNVADKNHLLAYRGIPMTFDLAANSESKAAKTAVSSGNFVSDSEPGIFEDYKYTTLVNPFELFGKTYGKYITVKSIGQGEGYTVDANKKTVTVNADSDTITLPITFASGKTEETVNITVGVAKPEALLYQGLGSMSPESTPKGAQKAINIGDIVRDLHGEEITVVSIIANNDLLVEVSMGTDVILIKPLASGSVDITVVFSAGGHRTYEHTYTVMLQGYPAPSFWDMLMQNPIYLWIAGAALFVILLIIILLVAKQSRKKRLMKELETMLMAEMEADEQLKLNDGSNMMNMGMGMGGMYNPNQLGTGMTPGGYDPNMLQLGSGMNNPMQGGYDPNRYGQSQMQGGYDPNQFGQSQMGGFDPNQFGQGNSQFGQGDGGSYIDLDDFNDSNK